MSSDGVYDFCDAGRGGPTAKQACQKCSPLVEGERLSLAAGVKYQPIDAGKSCGQELQKRHERTVPTKGAAAPEARVDLSEEADSPGFRGRRNHGGIRRFENVENVEGRASGDWAQRLVPPLDCQLARATRSTLDTFGWLRYADTRYRFEMKVTLTAFASLCGSLGKAVSGSGKVYFTGRGFGGVDGVERDDGGHRFGG